MKCSSSIFFLFYIWWYIPSSSSFYRALLASVKATLIAKSPQPCFGLETRTQWHRYHIRKRQTCMRQRFWASSVCTVRPLCLSQWPRPIFSEIPYPLLMFVRLWSLRDLQCSRWWWGVAAAWTPSTSVAISSRWPRRASPTLIIWARAPKGIWISSRSIFNPLVKANVYSLLFKRIFCFLLFSWFPLSCRQCLLLRTCNHFCFPFVLIHYTSNITSPSTLFLLDYNFSFKLEFIRSCGTLTMNQIVLS